MPNKDFMLEVFEWWHYFVQILKFSQFIKKTPTACCKNIAYYNNNISQTLAKNISRVDQDIPLMLTDSINRITTGYNCLRRIDGYSRHMCYKQAIFFCCRMALDIVSAIAG